MRRALLALVLLLPTFAQGEEIVLGLSQDAVAITANFDGSNLLIFGAIKRDAPIPDTGPLGVIIAVAGPDQPVSVRRKAQRYGIWVNTDVVEVDAAPSFYAVASSAPIRDVLRDVEDLRYSITLPRAIRSVGARVTDSQQFTDALIRIRAGSDLYQVLEGAVDVEQETLFRAAIALPANLTEGDYETRIFLTRNGTVIDEYDTIIAVNKVGVERWLFDLSREQTYLYGALSLVLAGLAGWAASAAFAALRR